MKKNLKLVLALILAAMMIVASISAFAADGDNMTDPVTKDAKIWVAGLADGDTVNFYQILEWKGETGTYGGWSLKAPFDGIVDANVPALKDAKTAIATIIGDPGAADPIPMALTSEIAGKLADLATTGAAKAGSAVADGKSELTVSATDGLGLYMALITPADANTIYNPVFVSADYNTANATESWEIATSASSYSDSGAAKKSLISVDKKDSQSTGHNSYDQTWRSTRPGEIVDYEVTTTIPGYGKVYQNPHFDIKDKLTDLKLVSGSLKVKVGATEYTATTANVVTITPADDNYTISFDAAFLKTIKAPTEVVVTYKAEVLDGEHKNVDTEHNEVWIEYSHNPKDETEYDYKKDDTEHYTYTIDASILAGYEEGIRKSGSEIVKVAVDASGKPIYEEKETVSDVTITNKVKSPLEGATFKLYTTYDESSKTGTEYTKADGTTLSLSSDPAGKINIPGLDAGVYYLVEDKAPSGFIRSTKPVKIEIKPTFKNQSVTMYTDGNTWSDTKTGAFTEEAKYEVEVLDHVDIYINNVKTTTHQFWNDGETKVIKESSTGTTELPSSIPNTKGVELPSTGGMGTTIFYVGGSILVLAAAILLITKRRMGVED